MPSITYNIKYSKNTGLILSPQELRDLYFFGVDVTDSNGNSIPDSTIQYYIESAQREIEQYLKIKFKEQLFDDNVSYHRDDYAGNGYPMMKTRYPVNEPLSLTGLLGRVESVSYPKEWLKAHYNSDRIYLKKFSIVPVTGSVGGNQDVILSGLMSSAYGYPGYSVQVPEYWNVQYVTGFGYDNLPMDLLNLVGMYSSIGIFNLYGDILLGAGIASQSLSIDGLSSSISTTSSAENSGFSSRIIQYKKNIQETLKRLTKVYNGINFTVL